MQTALNGLGLNNVTVTSFTGTATTVNVYQVVFNNATNVGPIIGNSVGLVGGTTALANLAVGQTVGIGLGFTGEQTIAALTMAEGPDAVPR